MDVVVLAARLSLAAVLIPSGVLKAFDRGGARKALPGLGVPGFLAPVAVWLLPPLEILLGVLIVVPQSARLGSLGAAVLFVVFTILTARVVVSGRKAPCHCFGALSDEPISSQTIVRNLILLALAVLSLFEPAHGYWSSFTWLRRGPAPANIALGVSLVALVIAAVTVGLAFRLLRAYGLVLEARSPHEGIADRPAPRPHLGSNDLAPSFELASADGSPLTLTALLEPNRHVAFVSVNHNCGPCRSLMPQLATWAGNLGGAPIDIVLLTKDVRAMSLESESHGLRVKAILQDDTETSRAYGIGGTPSAVIIGPDARIKLGPVGGSVATMDMLNRLVALGRSSDSMSTERRLAQMDIRDASGRVAPLHDYLKGISPLIFWNNECPHCTAMADQLEEWSRTQVSDGKGGAILLSSNSEATLQFSNAVTVLIDENARLAHILGMRGTPSAVLVDTEGTVRSNVAVGRPDVFDLLKTLEATRTLVANSRLRQTDIDLVK